MMEHIYQDIPRAFTALSEWGACLVYILLLTKRFSNRKTIVLALGMSVIQSAFMCLTGGLPTAWWLPCMAAAVLLMFGFICCCCEVAPPGGFYYCIKAFILAEFAASLEWQLHTFILAKGIDHPVFQVVLLIGIYSAVFALAGILEKSMFKEEYLKQISVREIISAVGIVLLAFGFSNLSFVFAETPFSNQLKADIFNTRTLVDLGGMAVLYAYQSRIFEYLKERELTAMQAALKSQYAQYRHYQNATEMIQIKYHDLKHQITGLRYEEDAEKRKEWLDTIEQELDVYGTSIQTGSQVLDGILASKLHYCQKHNVRMTCVADGRLLDFLHVTDLCTIFGNALDNAIESVILIPDSEKRLIHFTVTTQRDFVFIKIENYCENSQEIRHGQIPATTKADKKNHGFGLKSIRYTVEKYQGNINIGIENNWFQLKILFPKTS